MTISLPDEIKQRLSAEPLWRLGWQGWIGHLQYPRVMGMFAAAVGRLATETDKQYEGTRFYQWYVSTRDAIPDEITGSGIPLIDPDELMEMSDEDFIYVLSKTLDSLVHCIIKNEALSDVEYAETLQSSSIQ